MAPLTRNRAIEPNTVPSPLAPLYYRQRDAAGLLISEATQISQQGQGYVWTPGCFTDEQVEAWRKVTDVVHEDGGHIFLQLWHVGRISHASLQPNGGAPVAPSAIRAKTKTFIASGFADVSEPRALETSEIAGIVADYAHAAGCARRAGFDGVELHGANGYLIDQFLRDGTNKRTDAYGGGIENRLRFALEVVDAVLKVWPATRVGIRIAPVSPANDIADSNPAALFGALAEALAQRNLAYIHVVEGATRRRARHRAVRLSGAATRVLRRLYRQQRLHARDGDRRRSRRTAPTWSRSAARSSPIPTSSSGCGSTRRSPRATARPSTAAAPRATPTIPLLEGRVMTDAELPVSGARAAPGRSAPAGDPRLPGDARDAEL